MNKWLFFTLQLFRPHVVGEFGPYLRLIILPQLVAELELDKKRASFLRSLLRASYHTSLLLRKTLSVDMTDILSAIICFGDTPRKRIPSTSYILVGTSGWLTSRPIVKRVSPHGTMGFMINVVMFLPVHDELHQLQQELSGCKHC